jgi:hypothetical protein
MVLYLRNTVWEKLEMGVQALPLVIEGVIGSTFQIELA